MSKPIVTQDSEAPTDSQALGRRLNTYDNFALKDVNDVLGAALADLAGNPSPRILDIGCGTGKQVAYVLKHLPGAEIHACDASAESIGKVKAMGAANVHAEVVDYNDDAALSGFLSRCGGDADLVLAFFSIYYADDVKKLLRTLRGMVGEGGRILLVGYSKFNNRELLELIADERRSEFETDDFLYASDIGGAFETDAVSEYYFTNPIRFPTLDDFLAYYRNYGLYDKATEPRVAGQVSEEIERSGHFTLTKISKVVIADKIDPPASARLLPLPLKCDTFSPALYETFLDRARADFEISTIAGSGGGKSVGTGRQLILRHDVDLVPAYALEMARAEAARGVAASYYFLLNGEFYNVLDADVLAIIREIHGMGHEIGLHFDEAETIELHLKVLSAIIGEEVASISQHNPTVSGFADNLPAGLINAYDDELIDGGAFRYVSDSGMKWRGETIFDLLGTEERIYFLAHPESWYSGQDDIVQIIREAERRESARIGRNARRFVATNINYLTARRETD